MIGKLLRKVFPHQHKPMLETFRLIPKADLFTGHTRSFEITAMCKSCFEEYTVQIADRPYSMLRLEVDLDECRRQKQKSDAALVRIAQSVWEGNVSDATRIHEVEEHLEGAGVTYQKEEWAANPDGTINYTAPGVRFNRKESHQ